MDDTITERLHDRMRRQLDALTLRVEALTEQVARQQREIDRLRQRAGELEADE